MRMTFSAERSTKCSQQVGRTAIGYQLVLPLELDPETVSKSYVEFHTWRQRR